ncbi:LysE/ArgO family amino acid transporter [Paraglaciecola arctica]|uniref:L-lysine exporter family protein LysE/ArgO n=1 Tax=Paraglaciecola arctica BSs20135 TaxID=493475 RepID=K6YJR8_9ALTE|nr:LysE/ArgO family amino acid transporter [Paraglaciecola arctica]GAC18417.1 L-lysine exporter family protein LysE/ArgO [Paraglaciecola arctica BSs20135]
MQDSSTQFSVLLQGFLTGAVLIIAIGSQNAFLLQQGLLRRFHWQIATLCSVLDTLLICAGVFGLGMLVKQYPQSLKLISVFGVVFLLIYGYKALRSAMNSTTLSAGSRGSTSLKAAVLTTLALSLLNPHVYLDTVLLIGSVGSQFESSLRPWFAVGAVSASFLWFYSLAHAARWLAPFFKKPIAWRILDLSVCLIMWGLALNLMLRFLA